MVLFANCICKVLITRNFKLNYHIICNRMAPEVIACDEQPDATYDNRVGINGRALPLDNLRSRLFVQELNCGRPSFATPSVGKNSHTSR